MNINDFIKLLEVNTQASFEEPEDMGVFSSDFCAKIEDAIDNQNCLELLLSTVEKKRNRYIKKFNKGDFQLCFNLLKALAKAYLYNKDLRYINTMLKILSKVEQNVVLGKECDLFSKLIKILESEAERFVEIGETKPRVFYKEGAVDSPIQELEDFSESVGFSDGVVVFSPNPRSSYTLATLTLLEKKGIKVKGVLVRRLFSYKRIMKELRRDGMRLVNKVYRKLILNDSIKLDPEGRNLNDTVKELHCKDKTVFHWCKRNSVKVFSCDVFHDADALDFLNGLNYSIGIFTGGGILTESVLNSADIGFLNCHAGLLPHYRGMDVIEWPVLQNDQNNTGGAVHFMTKDIDEGEIVLIYRLAKQFDIKSARYELESYAPYLIVLALLRFLSDGKKYSQQSNEGLHYYVMHPFLFNLALRKSS